MIFLAGSSSCSALAPALVVASGGVDNAKPEEQEKNITKAAQQWKTLDIIKHINTITTQSPHYQLTCISTNNIIQKQLITTEAIPVEENMFPILHHMATQSKITQITTILIMHHIRVLRHLGFGQL